MRPSNPSSRSVSAALAPARLAPTITCVCSLLMGTPLGKGQELLAGTAVVADLSAKRRGDGLGAELLDAAEGHAHVLRLEDDSDSLRLQLTLEPIGDLRREPLLDLEVAAEELDHPAELAEPDDPLARQIAD